VTDDGLVMASDSRSNAGFDQVNVCRKMYRFVHPGERAFVILCSGSLSISQSVITLLRSDFNAGRGLACAESLYEAARIVGDCIRAISDLDRASLERDQFNFNVHLLLGGQVKGEAPGLPILDRGVEPGTTLEVAAKYALLAFDATIRSNVTVGPPIEILLYRKDALELTHYRRFSATDQDLNTIHSSWEQSLRRAVEQLPEIEFRKPPAELST
jgi:putative proteasome-type protease